jgi:hypothetical protein
MFNFQEFCIHIQLSTMQKIFTLEKTGGEKLGSGGEKNDVQHFF